LSGSRGQVLCKEGNAWEREALSLDLKRALRRDRTLYVHPASAPGGS